MPEGASGPGLGVQVSGGRVATSSFPVSQILPTPGGSLGFRSRPSLSLGAALIAQVNGPLVSLADVWLKFLPCDYNFLWSKGE